MLRISTIKEQPLEASKWIHVQALLEPREMANLFDLLNHPPPSGQSTDQYLDDQSQLFLFQCGSVSPRDQINSSSADFLQRYTDYIDVLKSGEIPSLASLQPWFSMVLTASTDALFTIHVGQNQQIMRVARPVIQMQAGTIDYSPVDKKFRSMVFGQDNISWGIQFSYPHIFQDPVTREIHTVTEDPEYPNTKLFHSLQKWMRQHTIPTPFYAEGSLINVPMRLGKSCLPWINRHPQLLLKGISIKESSQ